MEQRKQSNENGEIKKPDYIYLETEGYEEQQEFGGFQHEFQHSYQKMGARNYPLSVRFVCLLCSSLLLFFLLLATPFLLLFFGINVVTLFQWDTFLQRTRIVWNAYSNMLVTALGLLVAVLSPPFGISIILVYFMMQGKKGDNIWVERIFRASERR